MERNHRPAARVVPEDAHIPTPGVRRWQLLRAGLQNIWEYDDQRFVFEHGRLLLRGQNESGKTKALELLLPFLLDANLSPTRLDPFRSNARHMRWNLINDDNASVNVSIGYVWLEFGRVGDGDAPQYCTIGAGLRAKRQTPTVDSWYFVTPQRVDLDLALTDAHRVPRDRAGLVQALGATGQVFERPQEYRRTVNQTLFAMPEEQYAALIDALLRLRQPQLSKQLEPDELSKLLTASLPPLDSAAIGALAEGFQRLDRHRQEREDLVRTLSTVREFLRVYRRYAAAHLRAGALELTRADSRFHAARAALRAALAEKEHADAARATLDVALAALAHEDEALLERLRTLRSSDEFRAIEALDRAVEEARDAAALVQAAAARLEREERGVDLAAARLTEAEQAHAAQAETLERARRVAAGRATDAALEGGHHALEEQVAAGELQAARGILESLLADRARALRQVSEGIHAVEEKQREFTRAEDRLRNAEADEHEARARVEQAVAQEAEAIGQFQSHVAAWCVQLEVLQVDGAEILQLFPAAVRPAVEAAAHVPRAGLENARAAAQLALQETRRALHLKEGERDALAAATHRPPDAPHWRHPRNAERAGTPFYLACEFKDGVLAAWHGAIEGALEAAGVLDAWLTPDGRLLAADIHDTVLIPASTSGSATVRTLADVLEPAPDCGVAHAHVERVLASIAFVVDEPEPQAAFWVTPEGRFGAGPLHGTYAKDAAQYIGTTARERTRAERLRQMQAEIAALVQECAGTEAECERLLGRLAALDAELKALPPLDAVRHAAAVIVAASADRGRCEARREEAAAIVETARTAQQQVIAALEREAAALGLGPWIDRLEDLRERTQMYVGAAQEVLAAADRLADRVAERESRRTLRAEAAQRADEAKTEAEHAGSQNRRIAAHVVALRDLLGATRDQLMGEIHGAEARRRAVAAELETGRAQLLDITRTLGAVEARVEAATVEAGNADAARHAAETAFRDLAARGLLRVCEVPETGAAAEWSYTDTLLAARQADEATSDQDDSQEARDRLWNRVSERHQDLLRGVPGEIRILSEQTGGMVQYGAVYNGRRLQLIELVHEIQGEIAARERLLGDEERKLFESFLTGEAHEHLRSRLLDAGALIERIDGQLQSHPSSSGMRMRLVWHVAEAAPAGTRQAIELMSRAGHLLSDANRDELARFLQERMTDARDTDGTATLHERMMAVLDYRSWHEFHVEFQTAGAGWKRLTRKTHAAGSGGQKAVMLHLPLFAAAAAFYESAGPQSPRLIVLDEAFAGIDRETRGQLMGLLAQFDLDFVMTSFEEWGFYAQLDGMSTYHLARERGMRGVFTDWFLWNGHESVRVETP